MRTPKNLTRHVSKKKTQKKSSCASILTDLRRDDATLWPTERKNLQHQLRGGVAPPSSSLRHRLIGSLPPEALKGMSASLSPPQESHPPTNAQPPPPPTPHLAPLCRRPPGCSMRAAPPLLLSLLLLRGCCCASGAAAKAWRQVSNAGTEFIVDYTHDGNNSTMNNNNNNNNNRAKSGGRTSNSVSYSECSLLSSCA